MRKKENKEDKKLISVILVNTAEDTRYPWGSGGGSGSGCYSEVVYCVVALIRDEM